MPLVFQIIRPLYTIMCVQVVETRGRAGKDGDDHEGVYRHPYPDEGVSHKLRHLAQHFLLLRTWVPFRRRQPWQLASLANCKLRSLEYNKEHRNEALTNNFKLTDE